MPGQVKIDGWTELKRALEELPRSTQRRVQERVLKKRAQPIAALAKQLAPKDTGALAKSIFVTTKRPRGHKTRSAQAFQKTIALGGTQSEARAASKEAGRDPVEVFIGPQRGIHGGLPVDRWQEWGTRFYAPHPYMRPAMDRLGKEALQGIGRDMGQEIERAAAARAKRIAKGTATRKR